MKRANKARWLGWLGLSIVVAGCRPDAVPEPHYGGKSLGEWAEAVEDQGIDGRPSAIAREAADAIRSIGAAQAVPCLVRWLQPPWEHSGPGRAMRCFQVLGPEAKAAIPELGKLLNTRAKTMDQSSAQTMAAEALSYLGPEAVPVLLTAITNFQGQHLQWEMIQDLAHFGTNGAPAKLAVLKWSRDTDDWVRLGALHAYVAIESDSKESFSYLLRALKDKNDLVRRDAAEMLGDAAHGQTNALPALLEALKDPDWQVRSGAVQGLGQLGVERSVVLPLLVEKLQDENRIIRRCAAFALGEVGGKAAFEALLKSTDDPDGFVREAVFHSLKRIDANALQRSGKRFY